MIGLDFLPEMLARTASAAKEAGLGNVTTLEGDMEDIPLPDDSVDHVISNGVINLSPRKARVLAECARVLRPGGRLSVSDLTMHDEELPPEVLTHPAAWAGCVAGVLTERAFIEKLHRAGFQDVEIGRRRPFGIDDCTMYPLFTNELISLMKRLIPSDKHGAIANSIVVKAHLRNASTGGESGPVPGERAAPASHLFDAGDMGCSSGLPGEFRRRMDGLPGGESLTVVVRDPAAKEDLPSLARMLGHTVESVEDIAGGRVSITVQRGSR